MLKRIRKAREAYRLGATIQRAMERARKLHPWKSRRHSMDALIDEVDELRREVVVGDVTRIGDEAIDVAVVALRIAAGG